MMTQERFFELVYAWKDGDLTGDELYQRVFVLSNVVGQSEQFICHSCNTKHSGKNDDQLHEVCKECFDSI